MEVLAAGIIKRLLEITRNKKKKLNEIVILGKSKSNTIETLICQAFRDIKISHEEFETIVNDKEKHEKMKEDIRMIKSSNELNKEKGKTTLIWVKIVGIH